MRASSRNHVSVDRTRWVYRRPRMEVCRPWALDSLWLPRLGELPDAIAPVASRSLWWPRWIARDRAPRHRSSS
jgi:hypothetical protein